MKWRWIGGNLSKQIWDKQRQMLLYYCSTHCRRISRDLYIRRILAHPSSIHVPERELGPASNYCKRPDRMHDNDVAFDYRSPVAGGFDGWAMRQQSVPLLCRMAVYRPNSLVIRHRAPSTRGEPSPWWGLLIAKKKKCKQLSIFSRSKWRYNIPFGYSNAAATVENVFNITSPYFRASTSCSSLGNCTPPALDVRGWSCFSPKWKDDDALCVWWCECDFALWLNCIRTSSRYEKKNCNKSFAEFW